MNFTHQLIQGTKKAVRKIEKECRDGFVAFTEMCYRKHNKFEIMLDYSDTKRASSVTVEITALEDHDDDRTYMFIDAEVKSVRYNSNIRSLNDEERKMLNEKIEKELYKAHKGRL